jgi:uncharacterized cupredoxin-like copper-binding protein
VRRYTALSAILLIGLMSGCAPGGPTTNGATVIFRYSHFDPGDLRVKAGVPTTFTLRNDDPIEHEWIVGPNSIHQVHRVGSEAIHNERPTEVTVPPYATKTTTVVFDQPGVIQYICHLPGHEEYGMKGVLTVVR